MNTHVQNKIRMSILKQ